MEMIKLMKMIKMMKLPFLPSSSMVSSLPTPPDIGRYSYSLLHLPTPYSSSSVIDQAIHQVIKPPIIP